MNPVYRRLMAIDWGRECPEPVETLPQMMKAMYLETFKDTDPLCANPVPTMLSAPRRNGRGVFCMSCKKWHSLN